MFSLVSTSVDGLLDNNPAYGNSSMKKRNMKKLAKGNDLADIHGPGSDYYEGSSQGQDEMSEKHLTEEEIRAIELQRQKAQLQTCLEQYASSTLVIPSCSSWFEVDKVHEFEM